MLDHANAFIPHAGRNSTMESLFFQVPLVAVPQVPEQHANTARAEELAPGVTLPIDGLTSATLRDAVEEVATSPHGRANLAEMRAYIDSVGGAVAAADAPENHLAR